MRDFVHLHAHSTYSILDAWGKPDAIVERLQEAGLSAHALTDHDSVSGHVKFQKEMKSAGLKPLFGIEIRVVDNLEQREEKSEEGKRFYPYHLGLIAKDTIGYRNLLRLTALAWQQGIGGRGKYMPVVTWGDIKQHQDGLIGTSGCLSGKISRTILGQTEGDWRQTAEEIEDCFEPDSFFLEWQNIDLDACREVAEVLAKRPNSVVTHDVHFPDPSKQRAQNIMSAIARYKKVVGPDGQGPMREQCFIASPQEVEEIWKEISGFSTNRKQLHRAMDNTLLAASMVDVELPKLEMVRFPLNGQSSIDYFKQRIREGWNKRGVPNLPTEEKELYRQRMLREVDVIIKRDFVDYFLIISDICRFCVENDILKGPARGSSAGSLVAWLLEITEINPIPHGLIFERFIGLEREELPDIDMDFPDNRREEIHAYLIAKYGKANIGYIGTFTTFKAKNSLDDVARVFELPHWVPNKIKPYIPDRAHGDVRSFMTLADSMDSFEEVREIVAKFPDIRYAQELEGQFRGVGVHPAGFVVSSHPLEDVAPIYWMPDKERVVGLDMYDCADAGLLKIDLLGLSTMTVLAHARDAVRERHGIDIDFYGMPLDDENTLQGFRDVDVLGIFQFQGKATKNTLRQIKVTKFGELADINTLSRPGAMLAGTSDQYVAIHQGKKQMESIHPIVDAISSDTFNLVIYQEQVLRIMTEFGGLSWKQAGEVRKDISKRMGVEKLQRFKEAFVEGAAKKGISEEIAMDVWMKTSTFGAYGFNKSHSVAYAVIAYWQMYVKRHFPTEFYYASLAVENDLERRDLFIMEAKRKGIAFLPVDANKSGNTFTLDQEGIRYGLSQIKGIGDKTAQLIIESRPIRSRSDLLAIRGIGEKTASLFDEAFERGDDLFGLESLANGIRSRRKSEGATGVLDLRTAADAKPVDTATEHIIAAHVISRNYRQEQKLSIQAKDATQAGAKSDTVIVYIRDESGESMPVVIPGWLAGQKTREIWEGEKHDVYLIRGRLPFHGKFFLANGLANADWQERKERLNEFERTAHQPRIPF